MLPSGEFFAFGFYRSIGDRLYQQSIISTRGFGWAVLDESQEVGRGCIGFARTFWVRDPQLVDRWLLLL